MHPNAITTTTLRMSALRGNLSVGWTFAKNREAGRPPSLWRMSICVVCWKEDQIPCKGKDHSAASRHDADYSKDQADQRQPIPSRQSGNTIRERFTTYIKRQIPPALLLVASIRICRSGPAAEVATFSMFPATNRRTIKNIEPVNTPIPTQVTMIFGPSMSAFGTSKNVMCQSLSLSSETQGNPLPSIMCATAS